MKKLMLTLALAGCSSDVVHHQFNVVSGDAVLPVAVHGNLGSGTLLVWESGGPSGPGIAERTVDLIDFRDTLEQDVAVVFYDRRGTGNAHGTYRSEEIGIEVLVDDLHAITRVLEDRYAPDQMVLAGHSFGSISAPWYVARHPDTFAGLVAVAPAWTNQDFEVENHYRRLFLHRVATDRMAEGDTAKIWEEALAFCEEHPVIEPGSKAHDELYVYLNAVEDRLEPWPGMDGLGLLEAVFVSHYNLIDTQMRENRISGPVWQDLDGVDLLAQLEDVEAPALIVTGEYDGIGTTEIGLDGLEHLATPDADKRLVELEGAGHYPFYAQPEQFADEVMAFVEQVGR